MEPRRDEEHEGKSGSDAQQRLKQQNKNEITEPTERTEQPEWVWLVPFCVFCYFRLFRNLSSHCCAALSRRYETAFGSSLLRGETKTKFEI